MLVMEDLTSHMGCRPRFWLNLLTVLEMAFIGDTPSSVLQVCNTISLMYQEWLSLTCVAMPVSFMWYVDFFGQIFTVSICMCHTVGPLLGQFTSYGRNMDTSGLPDMYTWRPRVEGVRIKANHKCTCYNCCVPLPFLLASTEQLIQNNWTPQSKLTNLTIN